MKRLSGGRLLYQIARGIVLLAVSLPSGSVAQTSGVVISEGLVIAGGDWYQSDRTVDPIEAMIVNGKWSSPTEGAVVVFGPGDERRWRRITADADGWLKDDDVPGGYVFATVDAEKERIAILEAMAHRMVYVNGVPRAGNLYQYKETWESWEPRFDYSRLPILLHKGRNELLLQGGRFSGVKIRIETPSADVMINERDITAPDAIVGVAIDDWLGVTLINTTTAPIGGLVVRAGFKGEKKVDTPVPPLPPLSVFKAPARLRGPARGLPGETMVELAVVDADGDEQRVIDAREIVLQIKEPNENQRRTFISKIDGSVQYYALNPAQQETDGAALFLSLHGAAVEAINQSGAYHAKSWGHIVAPTNRRPYGFNWEDWGRLDALEVLGIATETLNVDRSRVYLTGHSMGGHGTWHIGALYPDRFAAIGPSAGWLSFWSYRPTRAVEDGGAMGKMLMRATLPSRTMDLVGNYENFGIYVLHGADDDNVPVTESRHMVARLDEFHRDFVYHEEPDAGHWWDKSDEEGADCVDWYPMFDFFSHHVIPADNSVRSIDFRTPSPGVSDRCHWVRIEAQIHPLQMSRVEIRYDPSKRRFVGRTDNVDRMSIDLTRVEPTGPLVLDLDGRTLGPVDYPSRTATLTLHRTGGQWMTTPPAPVTMKGPERYGTFKDLFNHRVVFVYGTHGSREENDWAFDKARYDAETFWYQANGTIEVVSDKAFDPAADPDRNIVLYGNEKTNAAWKPLLEKSPVRVRPGEIRIGKKKIKGRDLGVLFVRPRRGSETACVGAVAGTGIVGMRLTDRRPYLQAGFAYPDLVVFCPPAKPSMECVCGAGFFGLDWQVDTGEFVWAGRAE